MRILTRKTILIAGASWLALRRATAFAQDAPAALPDVTVTAPSADRETKACRACAYAGARGARATSGTNRGPAPQAEPPPAPPGAATGRAARRYRPVCDRHRGAERGTAPLGGATLGDLLFAKPGITGSSFAPGASSRPIIRGLDVNRVGIVENGTGGGGASDLGEDHFVPIDPLATNQVEVVRGPAALRYGSTSIGGVVSASNNRIPEALPVCPAAPFQNYGMPAKAPFEDASSAPCVTAETRTAVSSVDRGAEGGILLDAGGGNFAVHADAYGRKSSDYNIPGYPYLFDQTRPVNGRQPNSAAQADGASIGGSYIFHGGFIGAAITQNDSLYRIPGIDGADHQTRIDAHQTKFTAKGEYRPDAAAIEAVRFWAGATDYKHNEIGLADPNDPSTLGVRQISPTRSRRAASRCS